MEWNRRSGVILVAILTIVLGVIPILFRGRWEGGVVDPAFRDRLRRATAGLEDQDWVVDRESRSTGFDVAKRELGRLVAEYPKEVSVVRNAAILGTLLVEEAYANASDLTPEALAQVEREGRESIERLIKLEPQTGVAEYLKARLALSVSGGQPTKEIVEALAAASQKSADELAFHGQLVAALETVQEGDPESESWLPRRTEALRQSLRLDPTNVYLQCQDLVDLARRRDAAMGAAIAKLRETLEPLLLPISSVASGQSPMTALERLEGAIAAEQWDLAAGVSYQTLNLVRSMEIGIYSIDLSRATGHPLDFVVSEPSEALARRLGAEKTAAQVSTTPTWGVAELLVEVGEPVLDVAVADVDMDRVLDVVVQSESKLVVSLRNTDRSEKQRMELTLAQAGGFERLVAVDLDSDDEGKAAEEAGEMGMGGPEEEEVPEDVYFVADTDFVLWGPAGIQVVLQVDAVGEPRRLEVMPFEAAEPITGVLDLAAYDFDHDSDVDLVAATGSGFRMLMNAGNGRMIDVTRFSSTTSKGAVSDLQLVDWDRDLDLDLVAIDAGRPTLLENVLYGRFRQRALEELGEVSNASSVLVWEADGIPSWDVALERDGATRIALTRTAPSGVTVQRRLEFAGRLGGRRRAEDLDNDGVQDLVRLSSGELTLAAGTAEGSFIEGGLLSNEVRGFEVIDWDEDGKLDVVMARGSEVLWLQNTTPTSAGWWRLSALGRSLNSGRINRHGIGTVVELVTGGRYQSKIVVSQRTHFGFGAAEAVAVARLIWPNGAPQGILDPKAGTAHSELVNLKGSCPFLYTWDGEKYVFVTDCLWAAPIGLQAEFGRLVPSREWEYLKVPGELLRRDAQGQYRIQLTEELWESAYFDEVRLIAVDHPADVEIYSNEKVGPPSIAEYRIHTVSQRRSPVSASGTLGQDVSDLIAQADGRFYQGFQQRIVQGLTPQHHLELDLGDLSEAKTGTLFLTGWIKPTDTSLNVGFTYHPDRDAPRAPVLQVRDELGEWVDVPTPMGFPGGKTKTIAIDLTSLLPRTDGRVRIVTTAEIYWDEAFLTLDDPAAEVRTTSLGVATADLHYRGFSGKVAAPADHPEMFDYSRLTEAPLWAPMAGRFTRYGDVRELLGKADDRMVVMGSGDEMTVVFEPLASDPPEGWKRDFLLYSVGWDKDADLNTIHGQWTEPLPYGGMQGYPYSDEEKNWETAEMQDFRSRYHQRQADWYRFWSEPFRTLESVRP